MEQDQKPKEKSVIDVIAIIFGIVLVLSSFGHMIEFIDYAYDNGWSAGQKRYPVGGGLLVLLGIVFYIAAIPALSKRGFDSMANIMLIILVLAALPLIGKIAGCSSSNTGDAECEAGRYGYVCR